MKPAAYLRASTAKQERRETIEIQRKAFAEHAQRTGVEFEYYADAGVSGEIALEERPSGRRLLADIRSGKVDSVFVWRADRLARGMVVGVQAVTQIEEHAVLESLQQGRLSFKDPAKIMMTSVYFGAASEEKALIRQRTMAGVQRIAPSGAWCGGPAPFGYSTELRGEHSWLVKFERPIPAQGRLTEVEVVRRMFEMAAAGKSCREIADRFNDRAIPPAYSDRERVRGKRSKGLATRWTPGRIRNLLRNPVYKGLHIWRWRHVENGHLKANAEPIRRECPAIVPAKVWERAQEALHERLSANRAHIKNDYLLRGLIRCARCGRAYVGTTMSRANGEREAYYRCNGRLAAYNANGHRCDSPSINGHDLEAAVWDDVAVFAMRPGEVLEELEEQMGSRDDEVRQARASIQELEHALAATTMAEQRNVSHLNDGTITRNDFVRERKRLEQKHVALAEELVEKRQVANDLHANKQRLAEARSFLAELRDKIDGPLSFTSRREIVKALVESVTVEPGTGQTQPRITVRYRFSGHVSRDRQWAAKQLEETKINTPSRLSSPRT